MKEHPILFSAPMVRAILADQKTQTRRVISPQPERFAAGDYWYPEYGHKRALHYANEEHLRKGLAADFCPYGAPGDRLWVRETWADVHPLQAEGRYSQPGRAGIPGPPPVDYRAIYRCDGEYPRLHFKRGAPEYPYRELCQHGCTRDHAHPEERWSGWCPSTHMPRWASRITLEITGVRAARVQDISEADAIAEGIQAFDFPVPPNPPDQVQRMYGVSAYFPQTDPTAVKAFARLWQSINGKRPGCAWADNPWVWVVEFKRVA